MKKTLLIVIGAILLLIAMYGCTYNGFVKDRENVDSQWANVETMYQKRADLVPNLVATVKGFAGLSPIEFFKGMAPAMIMAFSSASSVGTLPINLECAQKLGAKKDVASFVLPLGATINMDGTAIYQGVCAIFIATCYGIDLTLPQMLTIVFS